MISSFILAGDIDIIETELSLVSQQAAFLPDCCQEWWPRGYSALEKRPEGLEFESWPAYLLYALFTIFAMFSYRQNT